MSNTLLISYQTLNLPAPFAHAFVFEIDLRSGATEYSQEYFGREGLDEVELAEEGFTLEDDWKWKGVLPEAWIKEADKLIRGTVLDDKEPGEDEEDWIHLKHDDREGCPNNKAEWFYVINELVQVICEIAGREIPLDWVLTIDNVKYPVYIGFEKREFIIDRKPYRWLDHRRFLELIYTIDLDDAVNSEGSFSLDMRDGTRYDLTPIRQKILAFLG